MDAVDLLGYLVAGTAVVGMMYPYAIYPCLLLVLAVTRKKGSSAVKRQRVESVTVLIPAHNEELVIGTKLRIPLRRVLTSALNGRL